MMAPFSSEETENNAVDSETPSPVMTYNLQTIPSDEHNHDHISSP